MTNTDHAHWKVHAKNPYPKAAYEHISGKMNVNAFGYFAEANTPYQGEADIRKGRR